MTQPFSPRSNAISRITLFLAVVIVLGSTAIGMTWFHTDYPEEVNIPIDQPVPFSHQHHVRGLGLDCRFCHATVERSASAGMPDANTCMTCHSEIWRNAAVLEPIRKSDQEQTPVRWVRVTRLPDFVYFHHAIHIQKGVGCVTCHGKVSGMPLMRRVHPLQMKDCMECHTAPQLFLRPKDRIFDEEWTTPPAEGVNLVRQYHLSPQRLTDCNHCHR